MAINGYSQLVFEEYKNRTTEYRNYLNDLRPTTCSCAYDVTYWIDEYMYIIIPRVYIPLLKGILYLLRILKRLCLLHNTLTADN